MNYTVKKRNFEELLEEKSETFRIIYKTLVSKIENNTITPKEYFDMVFKIEDLKEDVDIPEEYLDIVQEYLVGLSYSSRMYTLDYSQEIIDEVYDECCDDWYLAECTNQIAYDAENNVFVYSYDNTDINCVVPSDVSCEKAPEWFKPGWEGLVNKTLSAGEFIDYYCELRDNHYLGFSGVKSKIKEFLCHLKEEGKLKVIANRALTVDTDDDFFDESDFPEACKTDGELTVLQFVDSGKILEQYTPYYEADSVITHFIDNLEKSYLNTLLKVEEMRDF